MLTSIGICLSLLANPQASGVFLAEPEFTLAWTHSIEKTRWEESYRVALDAQGEPVLIPGLARIKGSGAGMEPPTNAYLHNGWYVYQPATQPLRQLLLARSGYVPDYEWCTNGQCRPLAEILPSDGGTSVLQACRKQV